jgi:hypothetical protein
LGEATKHRTDSCRRSIASGTSFRTFNQEIFEDEFALAAVEWTAAAKARRFALGCQPWWGFESDNFVLCRADGAMEQRCYRFRHTRKIAIRQPSGSARRNRSDLHYGIRQLSLLKLIRILRPATASAATPAAWRCWPRSAAPRLSGQLASMPALPPKGTLISALCPRR